MRVADLTTDELKELIKGAVREEIEELMEDPDKGLRLCEDFEKRLAASIATRKRISLPDIKKKIGIS